MSLSKLLVLPLLATSFLSYASESQTHTAHIVSSNLIPRVIVFANEEYIYLNARDLNKSGENIMFSLKYFHVNDTENPYFIKEFNESHYVSNQSYSLTLKVPFSGEQPDGILTGDVIKTCVINTATPGEGEACSSGANLII
jgi:hypothetical protein